MRLPPTLALLPIWLATGIAQPPPPAGSHQLDLVADKTIRDGCVLHGVGHARAKLGAIVTQADEAVSRCDTGELELRGHVQATLPERPDKMVFRYGAGTLVTDESVILNADRLSIRNSLLRASGNIVVRVVDAARQGVVRLLADEMYMYLTTADASLLGNVRTTGTLTRRPSPLRFPPEIIK